MTKLSMTRADAEALHEFCKNNNCSDFGFAVEDGAYFFAFQGRRGEKGFSNIVRYIDGFNPAQNPGWEQNSKIRFGELKNVVIPAVLLDEFLFDHKYRKKWNLRLFVAKSKVSII